MSKAILTGASLNNARLVEANLCSAFMVGTQLVEAELSYANLTGAALIAAVFLRTSLCGTNFSRAILRSTWFSSVDLSQAKGLRTVASHGRVLLGVDTLITSIHGAGDKLTVDLKTFFRCGGLPQELLRALPRLLAAVQYDDCFICYGQSDLKFAEKLCDDLIARGVSCWLYEMDRTPGKWTWREIGEQRRSAEKMVVACSSNALVRDGVLKEIEEQIDDDPDKMVPVSLDGLWREPGFKVMRGNRNLKPFLEDRNWADFSRWESDAAHYEQAVGELLRGLRRKSGRTAKTA